MKRLLLILVYVYCCLSFSSEAYATGGESGGEVATPTVDAILNGTDGGELASTEDNLDNQSSETLTEDKHQNGSTQTTEEGEIYNPMEYIDEEFFPSHSISEVGSKLTEKGFDILTLVQIIGYIIVTIVFVVAIIMIAVNKSTGSNHSNNVGWGALIICAVCYVLIFIGPALLEWIKGWSLL